MKYILHPSASRGYANHGWLETFHTFSFADYYNAERIRFGSLRVLNDDRIGPSMGFGMHPHEDMEIITIPLSGALTHEDSMRNRATLKKGEVQMMSAGSGLYHSEFNASATDDLTLLQIWVLPEKKGIKPRYEQIELDESKFDNAIYTFIKPYGHESLLHINQQAWFSLLKLNKDLSLSYDFHAPKNAVYVFVIEGDCTLNSEIALEKRDGAGIWDVSSLSIRADSNSYLLLMEVQKA